ncbi:hypothetical protein KKB64_04465 [Patescibacteria group bacterium]|nr:hypothetical protein [Patescibacteria group bacterium]MBU1473003.1 hypothetical protein [Patescibacteria group bacterium]MBU2460338.1 hypothetical protein [Patescibacteria group bacterium]MBU2544516.1 hypothetical protein [Patescibacteria group bacterium]
MAPAEIWQGGKVVNEVRGDKKHIGKRGGVRVCVIDSPPGCQILFEKRFEEGKRTGRYLDPGDSETLDDGEIVKSV